MTHSLLESWKTWALADAEQRGLGDLTSILGGLAASTARLRTTAWQSAPDQPGSPDPSHPPDSPEPDTHGR